MDGLVPLNVEKGSARTTAVPLAATCILVVSDPLVPARGAHGVLTSEAETTGETAGKGRVRMVTERVNRSVASTRKPWRPMVSD
jgi:hypothetical protein